MALAVELVVVAERTVALDLPYGLHEVLQVAARGRWVMVVRLAKRSVLVSRDFLHVARAFTDVGLGLRMGGKRNNKATN